MAKRDPLKTLRNKKIKELTQALKELQPEVLKATKFTNEHSLNGKFGGKYAEFIDIKNEVIRYPEGFISLYFQGFKEKLKVLGEYAVPGNSYYDMYKMIKDNPIVLKWLKIFLSRTFLRNFDSLSKVRPTVEESIIWIGQKNASYGILITPRFKEDQWENDKSEIRHFPYRYWSIGHILHTGLVIPFRNEKISFETTDDLLTFLKNVIVRNSGSEHEYEIISRYCDYVKTSQFPDRIPFMIPEFRYNGIDHKHKYRLDFTIIDPFTMSKVGFEISPWSTHGKLTKIKEKTQKQINIEALGNFEKEVSKAKAYYLKHDITVLFYTDSNLKNYDKIFNEIKIYLNPRNIKNKLLDESLKEFLNLDL